MQDIQGPLRVPSASEPAALWSREIVCRMQSCKRTCLYIFMPKAIHLQHLAVVGVTRFIVGCSLVSTLPPLFS